MAKSQDHKPHASLAGERKGAASEARPDGWRETVESIVVAFILAFLFRTFEAEAFVIPTGSMAPTLYGQHRDVQCAQCKTRFAVGVSSGNAPDAEVLVDRDKRRPYLSPANRSHFAVCPNANCRFPNEVPDREIFAGDRILVNKFPYEYRDPERFDVVVFKFPEGAKTNYIKRLVGLPGEQVRLEGGDVKFRKLGDPQAPFEIARKPPEKQRALQLLVHDNDHPARDLLAHGWPEAWASEADSDWSPDAKARSFRIDGDPRNPHKEHWLRYTNYSPTSDDWDRALRGEPFDSPPAPQEVRDFYAYNGRITASEARSAFNQGRLPEFSNRDNGTHHVGDLTLNCTVETFAAEGSLTFELVEGARRYRCRIDLSTGKGQLEYQHEQARDDEPFEQIGNPFDTGLSSPAEYEVSFANVDDRLCLWVDDRLVKPLEFDQKSRYKPPQQPVSITERDKAPVGIAARGAKVRVSHLLIERDVYYIPEPPSGHAGRVDSTWELQDHEDDREDQFLMLGDNSPRSNDSRLWASPFVSRRLLIGKAFFIYWPHGVPFMNDGRGYPIPLGNYYEKPGTGTPIEKVPVPRMSLPFYPQIGRMHRIR